MLQTCNLIDIPGKFCIFLVHPIVTNDATSKKAHYML